jgi:hypothetical protein
MIPMLPILAALAFGAPSPTLDCSKTPAEAFAAVKDSLRELGQLNGIPNLGTVYVFRRVAAEGTDCVAKNRYNPPKEDGWYCLSAYSNPSLTKLKDEICSKQAARDQVRTANAEGEAYNYLVDFLQRVKGARRTRAEIPNPQEEAILREADERVSPIDANLSARVGQMKNEALAEVQNLGAAGFAKLLVETQQAQAAAQRSAELKAKADEERMSKIMKSVRAQGVSEQVQTPQGPQASPNAAKCWAICTSFKESRCQPSSGGRCAQIEVQRAEFGCACAS